MRPLYKHSLAVIVFLSALVVFFYYFGKHLQLKTLPQTEGKISGLQVSGEVTVIRDSIGIPSIVASQEKDAWYALGFVHGQERFFQMEMIRRAAEGRLSEVLGNSTLAFDKLFRTLRIKQLAEMNYQAADETTQSILKSYAAGVNDYLKNSSGHLPPELTILGFRPEEWKPVNSLEIIKMMAWELNMGWWEDIAFTALVDKVGEDKAMELIPGAEKRNATDLLAGSTDRQVLNDLNTFASLNISYRNFTGLPGGSGGSNNWAVTHSKSASGKAIIANDPHLAFAMPGKWVFAKLEWKDNFLAGFTLPGIPAVVIGTNKKVTWTMTNLMNDEVDFFREKQDSSGNRYYCDGAFREYKISQETIKVKDQRDVILTVKETHRGPVITGVHLFGTTDNSIFTEKQTISMSWVASVQNNDFKAFYNLVHSSSFRDALSAVKSFSAPAQNFIVADRNNSIGYSVGGKIPLRKSSRAYLVHDGTTTAADWNGFIAKDELPENINPEEDYLATANNPPASRGYYISNLWEPGARISRIRALLKGKDKHSAADFMNYQNDITSVLAAEIVPEILKAFKGIKVTDKNLTTALEILEKWEFDFDKYKQAPAVYSMFITTFLQSLLEDDLGKNLTNHLFFIANVPYRILENYILNNKRFFYDDVNTPEVETREILIRNSFDKALTKLEKQFGDDPALWQWGRMHTLTFRHFFSGASALLDNLFDDGPYGMNGDGTTINNSEYHFFNYENATGLFASRPFENTVGPSMRMIYDFAEPDVMYISLPGGISGNAFSPYYKNMTSDWMNGKYSKVSLSSVPGKHTETLKLLP